MVPFTGSLEDYPGEAQPRIRALREAAAAAGVDWPREPDAEQREGEGKMGLRDLAMLAAIAVLGPGLWLFGLIALIYLIVS